MRPLWPAVAFAINCADMELNLKEFIDLLTEYRSEESRRARRNVNVISFVVLAAWLLDIPLTDVRAFGINLTNRSLCPVLYIALALLGYWTYVLWMTRARDREIEKERVQVLIEGIKPLLEKREELRQRRERGEVLAGLLMTIDEKKALKAFELQQERTKSAIQFNKVIGNGEWILSVILSTFAFLVLLIWIVQGACVLW